MTTGSTATQALAAQVKPLYGVAPKPKKKPKARKKTSSRRR